MTQEEKRERIVAIIQARGVRPWESMVDDLLALFPAPSREELEKIFEQKDFQEFFEDRHCWPAIINWIMAWAGGTQCDHKGTVEWTDQGCNKWNPIDLSTLPGGCPKCSGVPRP